MPLFLANQADHETGETLVDGREVVGKNSRMPAPLGLRGQCVH
jgi:hypothetical protein